jgi:hypothetical protein
LSTPEEKGHSRTTIGMKAKITTTSLGVALT